MIATLVFAVLVWIAWTGLENRNLRIVWSGFLVMGWFVFLWAAGV